MLIKLLLITITLVSNNALRPSLAKAELNKTDVHHPTRHLKHMRARSYPRLMSSMTTRSRKKRRTKRFTTRATSSLGRTLT